MRVTIPILKVGERYKYKSDRLNRIWTVYFDEKLGMMAMQLNNEFKSNSFTCLHLFSWENMERIEESEGEGWVVL